MDIDRLSTEERERHMKERRCFTCHQTGHISRYCRSGGRTPDSNQNKYQGIKKTASTAHAMICNLVGEMEQEEKEKLLEDITTEQNF